MKCNLKFTIVPAEEKDINHILQIMRYANMHNVPSPEMPELDWKCFFVAKIDGRIVGAAGYKITSGTEAKTTLMSVLPDFREYGIGRALQTSRMRALCEQGIETLITNADIPETIEWYKKHFGYKEIGKLKKVHEFGRSNIDEWTTLQTDLREWKRKYDEQRNQ